MKPIVLVAVLAVSVLAYVVTAETQGDDKAMKILEAIVNNPSVNAEGELRAKRVKRDAPHAARGKKGGSGRGRGRGRRGRGKSGSGRGRRRGTRGGSRRTRGGSRSRKYRG